MYRVVIVEDDPMVCLLDRTFTEKDPRFQVVKTFQDGQSALAWLMQNPADLLILDVYMPVFTGLELLRELRAGEVVIVAFMVSAFNDGKSVITLLKLVVVDFLVLT
ncbi:MAG: response regulator, partial [Clostridiales bacterium]|nr:response regulator [Clostridiales bacterium]